VSEATAAAPSATAGSNTGPLGEVRSTGICILLYLVTFGIYGYYWTYKAHEEIKQHTGEGLGGVLGLVVLLAVGIVTPFVLASEVGKMYEKDGKPKPVTGKTGLWVFPGIFLIIGPIVWFVKVNGALNAYWRSKGVS
jgi:uncharacterized protein DUF4234